MYPLGSDDNIPSIPNSIAKRGTKYASGGEIIDVEYLLHKKVVGPAESLQFSFTLSTNGYPAGIYRFYVDYKRLDGDIIQTLTVDFDIR